MMPAILRRHAAALFLAAVIGGLMVYPLLAQERALGVDFRGIAPVLQDDELLYLALVRFAADGAFPVANPYFWEHRQTVSALSSIASPVLALPSLVAGVDVFAGRLLWNVLLPAAAFLLTYAVAVAVSRSRALAAGAGLFLVVGLFGHLFLRPVSPQFNLVFWLLHVLVLHRLVTRPPTRWVVGAGMLSFGALFYVYPYYWTHALLLAAFLAAALVATGDRRRAWAVAALAAGGLLLAVPAIAMSVRAAQEPGYADTLVRLGMVRTHWPGAVRIVALAAVSLGALAAGRRWRRLPADAEFLLFAAIAASIAVASNQQVVTGRAFLFSSHYHVQAVFGAVFTLLYAVRASLPALRPRLAAAALGCAVVAALAGTGQGIAAYARSLPAVAHESRQIQRYAGAFDWIRREADPDAVIYANELASEYLPAHTGRYVFFAVSAANLTATDAEWEERFLLSRYWDDVTPAYVREHQRALFFSGKAVAHDAARQQDRVRRFLGGAVPHRELVPDDAVAAIIRRAQDIQAQPFEAGVARYRVDYVLWDKETDPAWEFAGRPGYEQVFEDGTIVLYRVAG